MDLRPFTLVVCLLLASGCQQGPPPEPPTGPPAEDLSHWSVPALVQPELQQSPPQPSKAPVRPASAAETVHAYVPGSVYKVKAALDAPLDLILETGEKVQALIGSDPRPLRQEAPPPEAGAPTLQIKERWEYKEALDGIGDKATAHIFLRALEAGATLGLTVTTSKRVYYLTCQSVSTSPIRAVRWTYPVELEERERHESRAPNLLPDPTQPRLYHVGYQVQATNPKPIFVPRYIVDDGKKMFLVYPEIILFKAVPLVRAITSQGPTVVNSHQYLNVLILDGLFPRLELRIGPDTKDSNAEIVTITQGNLWTIECPNHPECPVWPEAASRLATGRAQ